jgi:hypothetical protein
MTARVTVARLTFGPRNGLAPVWSADGRTGFTHVTLRQRLLCARGTLIFHEAGEKGGGGLMALNLNAKCVGNPTNVSPQLRRPGLVFRRRQISSTLD